MTNNAEDSHRTSFFINKNASQQDIDRSCLLNFRKGIARIEYPGLVKDGSKAISSLGGMYGIEAAISDSKNKLELCLNPNNRLCKTVCADRDNSTGILIKITKNEDGQLDYDVVGVVTTHFKFNRIMEFIYLPLMGEDEQKPDVEYLYDKIFPEKLPTFERLISTSMPALLFPPCSARSEYYNQNKLGQFHQSILKKREKYELYNRKKQPRTFTYYISFQNMNTEVPDQPCAEVMEQVHQKGLTERYLVLKQLFDERPIYQRSAVQYLTRFMNESLKILLPAVAYYCTLGPWRTTWIQYGYNPQKDFNSRKYQTLDFRLKSDVARSALPIQMTDQSAKRKNANYTNEVLDDSCYLLKPDSMPPRRQKIYQYCDILLPEIQDMLQRLPKLPTYIKYDLKNGWFPARFIEQSREIVRNQILKTIRKRYQEEKVKQTQTSSVDEASVAYSSHMLSVFARGKHRSVGEAGISEYENAQEDIPDADIIDLIDDEEEDEDVERDQERFLQRKQIDKEYDSDENSDNSSEYEIDAEALEEINEMVSGAGSIFK